MKSAPTSYFPGVRLILWQFGLGFKKKHLDYLTGLGLIWLDIGLGLIKCNNQAEVPLQKYEDFVELSVKQFVTQSSLISLGQIICGV